MRGINPSRHRLGSRRQNSDPELVQDVDLALHGSQLSSKHASSVQGQSTPTQRHRIVRPPIAASHVPATAS
jgi:hypothetical protein